MNEHLSEMLKMAVFFRVEELKVRGGPTAEDMKKAQETSDILGEHGDILLHGGGKKGECAEIFNRTAHAVAVLAFVPGGVEIFGTRFEATDRPEERLGQRKEVQPRHETGQVAAGEHCIQA
jgi:hypothetical protein